MVTYKIHYAIEGVAEFTCDSKEEAAAMFDRLSKRELAEEGLLEADDRSRSPAIVWSTEEPAVADIHSWDERPRKSEASKRRVSALQSDTVTNMRDVEKARAAKAEENRWARLANGNFQHVIRAAYVAGLSHERVKAELELALNAVVIERRIKT